MPVPVRIPADDLIFQSDQVSDQRQLTISADAQILLVTVGYWDNSATTVSLTWNGQPMAIAAQVLPPDTNAAVIFYLDVTNHTGTNNLAWNFTEAFSEGAMFTVSTYKEVDLSSPIASAEAKGDNGVFWQELYGLTGDPGDMMYGSSMVSTNPANMDVNEQTVIGAALGSRVTNTAHAEKVRSETGNTLRVETSPPNWISIAGLVLKQSPGGISLEIDNTSHAHSCDAPELQIAEQTLNIDHCSHAHTSDAPTLEITDTLQGENCSHAHASDECDLIAHPEVVLFIDECLHAHACDSATLHETEIAGGADCSHAHASDSPTITRIVTVQAEDCSHAHTSDSPEALETEQFSIADCSHAHFSEESNLAAAEPPEIVLGVQHSWHLQTCDSIQLELNYTLAINDCQHAHTCDQVSVVGRVPEELRPRFSEKVKKVNDAVIKDLSDTVAIVQGNQPILGMFLAPYASDLDIEMRAPEFSYRTSDYPDAAQGETIRIGETEYYISSVQPDGGGMTRLLLIVDQP